MHEKYRKQYTVTTKYAVHDEKNIAKVGNVQPVIQSVRKVQTDNANTNLNSDNRNIKDPYKKMKIATTWIIG